MLCEKSKGKKSIGSLCSSVFGLYFSLFCSTDSYCRCNILVAPGLLPTNFGWYHYPQQLLSMWLLMLMSNHKPDTCSTSAEHKAVKTLLICLCTSHSTFIILKMAIIIEILDIVTKTLWKSDAVKSWWKLQSWQSSKISDLCKHKNNILNVFKERSGLPFRLSCNWYYDCSGRFLKCINNYESIALAIYN